VFVYGDDGADEKRERVTAVAVIAGYDNWWEELEQKWAARCQGIPFHAKDCESDQRDFRPLNDSQAEMDAAHKRNKALYRDLVTILAESKVGGIGIAIDLVAQKKILPGSLPLAYYRSFLEALSRVSYVAEQMGEIAEVTFDISTENEYNAGLLYSYMRNGDPKIAKWLHPKISFVQTKNSYRVQTADLLAYEAWKVLDHTVGAIKRKRASWEALRNTTPQRFETFSYSTDWFTDLRKHLQSGELQKIVGFNEDDYKNWLSHKNRQHSMSNLFHFIDWIRVRDEQQGIQGVRSDSGGTVESSPPRNQEETGSVEGGK